MKCPYCIKVCTKCKKILIAYKGNFNKQKGGKYGLYAVCKNCRKQYREVNKEYHKQYYKDNKEYHKQYYKDNKEYFSEYHKKHREANKEHYKEYKKQYYKDNPEKRFNKHHNRRQLEENQGTGITKTQWLEMMDYFDWKCAYSGEYIGGDNINRSIDHVIPLSKGGLNEVWNCVPMIKSYNTSKYNNDMIEWYKEQEFYSEARLNKIYEWIKYAYNKWGE